MTKMISMNYEEYQQDLKNAREEGMRFAREAAELKLKPLLTEVEHLTEVIRRIDDDEWVNEPDVTADQIRERLRDKMFATGLYR